MSLKTSMSGLRSLYISAGQQSQFARPFTSSSSLLASKDTSPQDSKQEPNKVPDQKSSKSKDDPPSPNKVKSVSQADKELRERLEQMAGEGGAAGIEYEDGKPNTMKRSVRNNMFRLI